MSITDDMLKDTQKKTSILGEPYDYNTSLLDTAEQKVEEPSVVGNVIKAAEDIVTAPAKFTMDIGKSLADYATGAVQGLQEVTREGNVLAETNPLALSGTPMQEGLTNVPAPAQTEEQVQAGEMYKKATGTFGEETVQIPAITVASILAPELTLAGITASQAYQGYKKGGAGGAVREATYGPFADWLSQPDLAKQLEERPAATTVNGILGLGQALLPVAAAFKGFAKLKGKEIPEFKMEEEIVKPKEAVTESVKPSAKPKWEEVKTVYDESMARDLATKYGSDYEAMANSAADIGNYKLAVDFAKKSNNEKLASTYQKMAETEVDIPQNVIEKAISEGVEIPKEILEKYPDIKIPGQMEGQRTYIAGQEVQPSASTYDRTVTKPEIIKDIDEIVPARTGRIGTEDVEGIFKEYPEVIRSQDYGNFAVYSHELGHYVYKKLGDTSAKEELVNAAKKLWGDNEEFLKYSDDVKAAEGAAEFVRQHLINPETAKANFPEFSKIFESKTEQPLLDKINDIGDKMRRWQEQSAEARGRGIVSHAQDITEKPVEKLKNVANRAYELFLDDLDPIKRSVLQVENIIKQKLPVNENPYVLARMAKNSAISAAEMLVKGKNPEVIQAVLNELYNGALKHSVTMQDIVNKLESKSFNTKYPDYLKNGGFKNWEEALSSYLVAKRSIELKKIKGKELLTEYKTPISSADADIIIKNAPAEFSDLAKMVYDYNDNILSMREANGLITKEQAKEIRSKYENYVPMFRDFSQEGKTIFSKGIKKISDTGSTRAVINPIESMIRQTYQVMQDVESNGVKKAFVEWNKKEGLGRFAEEVAETTRDQTKSIFTVLVDGEKKAYQTTPELYRAITSLNKYTSDATFSLFKPFAKALRIGATISPDFIVRNMIRDTLTAPLYTDLGFKPVLDTAKGLFTLLKDEKAAGEFKAAGVPMASFVGMDRQGVNTVIRQMLNDKNIVGKVVDGFVETVRNVSEKTESATRMGVFQKAREQGMGIKEAGFLAKEATLDFSRAGSVSRNLNQVIPFFNAVLQGGDRFVRSLHDNPISTVQSAIAYITVPSIALWAYNHNEDWYKETPDYVKNAYWLIKSGDTVIRIPKPFEPGLIFGSAIERSLDQAYNDDKEAVQAWVKTAIDGFTPSIMPAAIGPIVEWITNYNLFMNRNIVGRKEQQLPTELQYNAATSEFAKKIGKEMGLSPMKIDNTISGYFGSAGKFIAGMGDYVIGEKKELPAKKISELPGIKGFTYDPYKNPKTVQEFYDTLDEQNKQHAGYGTKGKVPADLRKMRKDAEVISKLNKANRDITVNNQSPEEKRRLIDANEAKILEIAKKYRKE